jgi:poly(3-hydroxyalkanoate) depolymerase
MKAEMTSTAIQHIQHIELDGHRLRVAIRPGRRPALLLFNGIGANLELLEPLTRALDGIETITFDVPGVGGSAPRVKPYRLRNLARLATRLLDRLGHHEPVDVLGLSWGGTLAQQFARSHPDRCRRLVLAATTAGILMVPGSPFVLGKLLSPRRYADPEYLTRIAPQLYGGDVRRDPALIEAHREHLGNPHWLGYLYQQLALWGWSSLPWLAALRQPTLVLAGRDDPIVPLVNARVLAMLIPRARLQVFDDGHLFLLTRPERIAPLLRDFLGHDEPGARPEPVEAGAPEALSGARARPPRPRGGVWRAALPPAP